MPLHRPKKIGIALFGLNCIGIAAFLLLRPSAAAHIHARDIEERSGRMVFTSTADPTAYIAGRPLYQWNEWHGGEERWVKALELLNLPALVLALLIPNFLTLGVAGWNYEVSWAAAILFVPFSAVWWLGVGNFLARIVERRWRAG